MTIGICKLTKKKGKFVKAHIIPKALTYPEEAGLPFHQFRPGHRPIRRWSSWYDQRLVIEEGEAVLRDLDTWAITFLRAKKLVWSGWGAMTEIRSDKMPLSPWGIRKVAVDEPERLRRFLLSILWRAAASDLSEFKEVHLPAAHLERLRKAILMEGNEAEDFYPATCIQLSTLGLIHNHTPLAENKTVFSSDGKPNHKIGIFRFYFDGLIVHFHRHSEDDGYTKSLGPLVAGLEAELVVSTVEFAHSFQLQNLLTIQSESL